MNLDDAEDGADRRDVQRTKVLRNAKIIAPRRDSVIHCTVQNITSGGACLKLANTSGVPDYFELTFELGRTRRSCRVIWRTADQLGVAFEEVVTTAVLSGLYGYPVDVLNVRGRILVVAGDEVICGGALEREAHAHA